ncbi:APC family permease [Paractinoplanes globisporus]|uniref:APC family permease n=1 Tax=Paractinoplanes globisporus TaxID=113565 RepID=A0ABW6WIB9_9ACTN|nr:APC family permease [Actinoplanes globisporus]
MPTTFSRVAEPSVSEALAKDQLGAFSISAAIASSVAPMTVCALVFSAALATTGLVSLPIAIIVVAGILMLFVVGYLAMARHIPNAGAFYAYVAHGLGRPFGVGSAWTALLTYNLFQLCCYGGFGAFAAPVVKQWLGVDLPWYVLAFAVWIIVAVLGANEVRMSEKVLVALVVAETVLVLAYTTAIMLTPGFTFDVAALSISNLTGQAAAAGTLIVIGMTSFAGIEQSAVYIEESKNPKRTIPVATYATIITVGVLYWFSSWVQVSAGGPRIIERAGAEGADLFFNLAAAQLGRAALDGGHMLLGTSLIAALLAFHNAVARYTFALGREGVLPRVFGWTTRKGAPRNASLAQTALAFGVLTLYAIAGWDPLVQLFYWGSTSGGLGVLLLITATSIAVICYFQRGSRGESLWHRLIAPVLATAILLFVSYLAIDNLGTLFGVDPGTGPARIVPVAFLMVFAGGVLWGVILRLIRRDVYRGIGRGTHSAAATSGLSSILAERTA